MYIHSECHTWFGFCEVSRYNVQGGNGGQAVQSLDPCLPVLSLAFSLMYRSHSVSQNRCDYIASNWLIYIQWECFPSNTLGKLGNFHRHTGYVFLYQCTCFCSVSSTSLSSDLCRYVFVESCGSSLFCSLIQSQWWPPEDLPISNSICFPVQQQQAI